MKEKHLYTFGEFTVNAEDHTLTRGEVSVSVTPKMFDLLLVFVQHPGRVLGKEFLLQSVWPDSFVEEGNITFNIGQLRKVLEDDAQSPRFIETIPRRGYRFVAPVDSFTTLTPDKSEEALAEAARTPPPPAKTSRRYVLLVTGALVLLVGVLAIGGWLLKSERGASVPILAETIKSEKLSTDGGVYHVDLSPDGKNVVYTHRVAGKQSIWLRQLESANNVPIVPPSDDFYFGLAISPDGNSVYLVRGSSQGPSLGIYRMPIFGGVPQKIIDGTQGWISLSPKGDKISFVRCSYTDEEWCALFIADALDGRNERKLVSRPRPLRIGDNEISPDGKTVAFAVGQSRTSSNEFAAFAVDLETGTERELTPERFFNINYFEWLPDQSGLLMTAMQLPDRNFSIWNVSPSGSATKLTKDSETYSRLSLDAEGRALVATQVQPDFRLMLFRVDAPDELPRVLGDANQVAFAPDGKLYFSSQRTGNADVWSIAPDGSDLRQLTNDPAADVVPAMFHGSKEIFFESDRTGVIQIWRMDPDGTNQRQVTRDLGGIPLRVSADGVWLYYRSALQNALRRVAIETGQEEEIMKEMGRNLVLSPDFTRVAYSQRKGTEITLTVASVPDGTVLKTWRITTAPNLLHLVWASNGKYLAFILSDDAAATSGLWFQPLDGDARLIADLSGDEIAELAAFSLSDDEKSFALIKGRWKHDAVLFRGLK